MKQLRFSLLFLRSIFNVNFNLSLWKFSFLFSIINTDWRFSNWFNLISINLQCCNIWSIWTVFQNIWILHFFTTLFQLNRWFSIINKTYIFSFIVSVLFQLILFFYFSCLLNKFLPFLIFISVFGARFWVKLISLVVLI